MNSLFLHVGIDKTGSTATQRLLYRSESRFREYGLNYVVAGRGNSYHHDKLWTSSLSGDLSGWHEVASEVVQSSISTHVISHEGLYTLTSETLVKIKRILEGIDVKVIVYLRRQSDFVCSGLAQRVKQGQGKYLDQYTDSEIIRLGKDYEQLLDKMLTLADASNIKVRVYEPSSLLNRSVIDDFFGCIFQENHQEIIEETSGLVHHRHNPTPPVEVVQVLEFLRRKEASNPLYRYVVNLGMIYFPGDKSTFIRDKLLRKIDRKYEKSNDRVAKTWLNRRKLFLDERQFAHRAYSQELEDRVWSFVLRHLTYYAMPAWQGKRASLDELINSGQAVLVRDESDVLNIVIRTSALRWDENAKLSITFAKPSQDKVRISLANVLVYDGLIKDNIDLEMEGLQVMPLRGVFELTLESVEKSERLEKPAYFLMSSEGGVRQALPRAG